MSGTVDDPSMDVGLRVSNFQFRSGSVIPLEKDSIVVLVGPNNSGKTQSLKDIWNYLTSSNPGDGISIANAKIEKTGTEQQYLAFIRGHSIIRDNRIFTANQNFSPSDFLDNEWQKNRPYNVGQVFAKLIGAEDRLSAVSARRQLNLPPQCLTNFVTVLALLPH